MEHIFALPPKSFNDYPSNAKLFAIKDWCMKTIRSLH
jgi:hypothetical protein